MQENFYLFIYFSSEYEVIANLSDGDASQIGLDLDEVICLFIF